MSFAGSPADDFGCLVQWGENSEPMAFNFPDRDPVTVELGSVVEWDLADVSVHPL